MAKKTLMCGMQVVVEVDDGAGYIEPNSDEAKRIIRRADDVAHQIKRHVDGWQYVNVDSKIVSMCQFCGAPWSEDDNDYNGGCCVDDEESRKV